MGRTKAQILAAARSARYRVRKKEQGLRVAWVPDKLAKKKQPKGSQKPADK